MTADDQRVCLRCGEPAGDQRFCASCRSQLESFRDRQTRTGGDARDQSHHPAQAPRGLRLEQAGAAAAGEGRDPIGHDGSGAAFQVDPDQRTAEASIAGQWSDSPHRVARFEEVLRPKPTDVDRALAEYRQADAAGDPEGSTKLGVLLEQQGDREGAIAAYRRADERGDANGSYSLAPEPAERETPPVTPAIGSERASVGRKSRRPWAVALRLLVLLGVVVALAARSRRR